MGIYSATLMLPVHSTKYRMASAQNHSQCHHRKPTFRWRWFLENTWLYITQIQIRHLHWIEQRRIHLRLYLSKIRTLLVHAINLFLPLLNVGWSEQRPASGNPTMITNSLETPHICTVRRIASIFYILRCFPKKQLGNIFRSRSLRTWWYGLFLHF